MRNNYWLTVFCIVLLLYTAGISALCQDYSRPQTGTFVKDGLRDGYGELIVENNNLTMDGVAVLTAADKIPYIAVYVRHGESFKITGIKDGEYDFYFMIGEDWNSGSANFARADFYRTDSTLPYKTTIEGGGINYCQWTLSLEEAIVGGAGGAQKVSVPKEEFPELK